MNDKNKKKRKAQPQWKCTSKKRKLVGNTVLYDEDGGKYPMQINEIEDRDFNFHKVWMQNLIYALDEVSNQKLRVAFWIIDNLDNNNKLTMTQRQISVKSGICYQTVNRTMKILQSGDKPFLQKINSGAYRVNPEVLFKGSYTNRMGIIFEYKTTEKDNQEQRTEDEEAQKIDE